jgi:purine-nucleoside phosphorylase
MADTYKQAAAYLSKHATLKPEVGIICGSGLSGLSNAMTDTQVFKYGDIPGFPEPTVAGHAGELVFGKLEGVPTVCMKGRFHFYEGHPMSLVVMPVRAMRCLGVKILVVTTASGGLRPDWNVGDITCIMDHFALPCLVGNHPLMGPNDDALGPRFMPTSNAYDKHLEGIVLKSAESLGFDFVRGGGCHAFVSGPTYESPTEAKWLRQVGATSVSMSTVPEIITAHHCGMKVIGLALLTNKVLMPGDDCPAASHQEVLETTDKRAKQMMALTERLVRDLQEDLKAMEELPKIDLGGGYPMNGK